MQISQRAPIRIGIVLFESFSNHCLANAVEPLRAANTLAGAERFRWLFTTPDGAPVISSSGLPVQPAEAFGREGAGDYLFVLPSYNFRSHDTPEMRRALRAAARRYGTLVGLDTGAWLIAAAGLLDGRAATIHWDEFAAFAEAFPTVRARPARSVADGDRLTCGGATAAFELVTELIAGRCDPALAMNVGALFLHGEWPHGGAPALAAGARGRVDRAVAIMRQHVETPLPIPELARRAGLSQRVLNQEFLARMRMTPSAAYRGLRLEAARRFLEAGELAIAEIASRCGWQDHAAFARAFRAAYGTTPGGWRRSAGACAGAPRTRPPALGAAEGGGACRR